MNRPNTTDNWTIYNCHIHTFTRQHTPTRFARWVLADAELGRIKWTRFPVYLLYILVYFGVLILLARSTTFLSIRSDPLSLLGNSFVVLFQALLVIPVLVVLFILVALGVVLLLQGVLNLLIGPSPARPAGKNGSQLAELKDKVARGQRRVIRSNLLINALVRVNPASNDIFERTARFLKIAEQPGQEEVFREVELQYPKDTVFVVLPMDMGFMDLGPVPTPIEEQHAELLDLASRYPGRIIPFYAADPRHPDIVQRVKENLTPDRFRGIKIYPSLGYWPDDPKLMEVYTLCMKEKLPVVTHCSPGGIWQYGLTRKKRRLLSNPLNYKRILDTEGYGELKLCLAHFGGAEEWAKHLKGRSREDGEANWVRTIYEMISSGRYPNLYTDISYTVFTPKVKGLYVDLVDYLKVLLSHPLVRKRVLFGSDYYMVERESVSEKEVSLLLRSRLGEDLYRQIAYTNPREYLNIEVPPEPKTGRRQREAVSA